MNSREIFLDNKIISLNLNVYRLTSFSHIYQEEKTLPNRIKIIQTNLGHHQIIQRTMSIFFKKNTNKYTLHILIYIYIHTHKANKINNNKSQQTDSIWTTD